MYGGRRDDDGEDRGRLKYDNESKDEDEKGEEDRQQEDGGEDEGGEEEGGGEEDVGGEEEDGEENDAVSDEIELKGVSSTGSDFTKVGLNNKNKYHFNSVFCVKQYQALKYLFSKL